MNTTTHTTPSYPLSRDQFQSFRTYFRTRANNRLLTRDDILMYNVIRGLPLDRGFSPITSPIKIANGAQPMHCFGMAKHSLRWSMKRHPLDIKKMFDGNITDEQMATFAAML